VDPSFFSLHGIAKLLETLDLLVRKTGHAVDARTLVTLYSGRFQFVKEVVADIRKHLGERVFTTVIRFSIKLAEAASHGVPISHYCRRCTGFEDYQMLTAEVLGQEALRPRRDASRESQGGRHQRRVHRTPALSSHSGRLTRAVFSWRVISMRGTRPRGR
jgi:hypothetical protein